MFETHRAHADRIDVFTPHDELPQGNDREPLADTAGYRPSLPVIPEELDNADERGEDLEKDGETGVYPWADKEGNILLACPNRPAKSGNRPGGEGDGTAWICRKFPTDARYRWGETRVSTHSL